MTLGEKIRLARKRSGLSQQQLAEKLCVSRSAIAKWETDKGMPDVENLKLLSRLLQVSLDALLDDSPAAQPATIREPYSLAALGRGCAKVKKDRLMGTLFPQARIWSLQGRPDLTAAVSSDRGSLTYFPFGQPEFLKSVRELHRDFYLVEQAGHQLFVTVADDWWESHRLHRPVSGQSFRLGQWTFVMCGQIK